MATAPETRPRDYSVVVFPFLKTSERVSIGRLEFASTDSTEGLSEEQAVSVREISNMLFLRDDLRTGSASYAIDKPVDLKNETVDLEHYVNVQAAVAYIYAAPRHAFGDFFLSSEYASMAIFSPRPVLLALVRPDLHKYAIDTSPKMVPNDRGEIEGYAGLYNFRHHFWVTVGSRLYGPMPQMGLNLSQSLSTDFERAKAARADYRLLCDLLCKAKTDVSSRIFTATRWFNSANREAHDDAALIDLSIAFEALLGLPANEKTEHFARAVSLLLGRTPRLEIWARQFYEARSKIVHEGSASQLRYVATDKPKCSEGPLYQSLLSYGRRVFQLCLGTVLAGAELAEGAGLEETLVTNQERFERICAKLAEKKLTVRERLEEIAPTISLIREYRHVEESSLRLDTIVGTARSAALALLENPETLPPVLRDCLNRLATSKRAEIPALEALRELADILSAECVPLEANGGNIVRDLVEVAWREVYKHYHWLKQTAKNAETRVDNQVQQ